MRADLLAGIAVEVADLAVTRRFYDVVFGDRGAWSGGLGGLRYTCGPQTIEFVRRQRPRTYADVGQHQAYTVPADRFGHVVGRLAALGHEPSWWREDHPAERKPTAYFEDPSGNRVQLAELAAGSPRAWDERPPPFHRAGTGGGEPLLLDHAAIVCIDLEEAETFYRRGLGGEADYAHGFKSEDAWEAEDWGGKPADPCAPWTRRASESYRTHTMGYHPTAQVFLRFGPTLLGLVLAGRHIQFPPEEALRGAPRAILRWPQPPADAARYLQDAHLTSVPLRVKRPLAIRRAGRRLFFREFGGPNFVELRCAA